MKEDELFYIEDGKMKNRKTTQQEELFYIEDGKIKSRVNGEMTQQEICLALNNSEKLRLHHRKKREECEEKIGLYRDVVYGGLSLYKLFIMEELFYE